MKKRLLSAVRRYHSTQSKQSFLVKSISEVPLKKRYNVKMGESGFAETNMLLRRTETWNNVQGGFCSPDASSVVTPTFAYC